MIAHRPLLPAVQLALCREACRVARWALLGWRPLALGRVLLLGATCLILLWLPHYPALPAFVPQIECSLSC